MLVDEERVLKNDRYESKLWALACAYMTAKERVIDCGYAHEIDWQAQQTIESVTEPEFLREAAWVVLSAGMREAVIRRVFSNISVAFYDWESAEEIVRQKFRCRRSALIHFNSPRKIDSIIDIAAHVANRGFDEVWQSVRNHGVQYISQFRFMGPATSHHFAKNIGLQVAKPDRHLTRIAVSVGYSSPQSMCQDIAQLIGDEISVVDVVMWRYATIERNYLHLFSEAGLQAASCEDRGLCLLTN